MKKSDYDRDDLPVVTKGAAKQSKLLSKLEKNLPPAPLLPAVIKAPPKPEELIADSEDDFKYSRTKLKGLLAQAEDALETAVTIAREAEHPRATEVLSGMIKATSEVVEQLMDLHTQRKDLVLGPAVQGGAPAANVGPGANVAVFVGTTADLQKQLARQAAEAEKRGEVLDAEIISTSADAQSI